MDKIKLSDIDFSKLKKVQTTKTQNTTFVDGENFIKILDKLYLDEKNSLYGKLLALEGVQINNVLFPKTLIINDGKLEGYITDYFKNSSTLVDYFLTSRFINCKDIFEALKKASFILRDIHDAGIIYQDVHFANILINKEKDIKYIDIDGCAYQNYKTIFIPTILKRFIEYRKDEFCIRSENMDRISFMLSFFYIMYIKEIQKLSKRQYHSLSNNISTLENARLYANQLLLNDTLPDVPYLDEIINEEDDFIIDRIQQLPIYKRILHHL